MNHELRKLYEKYEELINNNSNILLCTDWEDFQEKSTLFFRGHSNKDWQLKPSILRQKDAENLFHYAKRKNYVDIYNNTLSLLAKKQHYKTGTRCLDFTIDFNIALYFACSDIKEIDNDGEIYIIRQIPHKYTWYTGMSLAKIDLLDYDTEYNFYDYIDNLKKDTEFINEISRTGRDVIDFRTEILACFNSGCMVRFDGKLENDRIKNQKGSLFVCGNKFKKETEIYFDCNSHSASFIPNDINSPEWIENFIIDKISIKSTLKQKILDYLNNELGINKEFLFPQE